MVVVGVDLRSVQYRLRFTGSTWFAAGLLPIGFMLPPVPAAANLPFFRLCI